MTNLFGTAAPTVTSIDADTGPLQILLAVSVAVPCVVTHARYYVASADLAAEISGSLPFQVWRSGEPDSVVTGTHTIPGTVGWVDTELSPHLQLPAGRRVGVAISLPATTPLSYGSSPSVFPRSNALMVAHGCDYVYQAGTIVSTDPMSPSTGVGITTNYMIDLEVAVSEMVNLDPGDLAVSDVIEVHRNIRGTVVSVTPITDAITVNLTVEGGPLDGTDVDVWVPDTTAGLAAADMELQKEIADPVIPSFHQAASGGGGDDSIWSYIGGGVYLCVQDGTSFSVGARTTRIATPSLVEFII